MRMMFCPCCGTDLGRYETVVRSDFRLTPTGGFSYRDKPICLTQSEHIFVMSLMVAAPAIIKREVLLERMDSTADSNVIDVMLCRLRKKILNAGGPPEALETVWGRGLRWNSECDTKDEEQPHGIAA